MKRLLIMPVTLLLGVEIARGYQGMSEAEMQKMMQNMQEAQACMQGIDQARLDAFRASAERTESEIKALCAKGERRAAEKAGLEFAREVSADPDLQKMQECGEKMQGMMPMMPSIAQAKSPDTAGKHICD